MVKTNKNEFHQHLINVLSSVTLIGIVCKVVTSQVIERIEVL